MCVLIFSTTSVATFLILRRIEQDMIKKCLVLFVKLPVILVRFEWNLNFIDRIRKILQYQISWKSFQWETSYYRRTDMTKLIIAVRNFANSSKKRCFESPKFRVSGAANIKCVLCHKTFRKKHFGVNKYNIYIYIL